MTQMQITEQEWLLLHRQVEDYEQKALFLRALAITLVAMAFIWTTPGWGLLAVIGLVWLQEAIWKTCQSRLEQRLLTLESAFKSQESLAPSLYTDWQASRPGVSGLVSGYIRQAVRPTVAVIYCALLLLIFIARVSW